MLVPSLAVQDMGRLVQFYRDALGMPLNTTVSPGREVDCPGEVAKYGFQASGTKSRLFHEFAYAART